MASIILSFQVIIEDYETKFRLHGPLFHRWIPDGEKDALILDTRFPHTMLKIWFERRGYVERGMIEFDSKRKEVDESIMEKQGVLEGGRLFGSLQIDEVTKEQFDALKQNKIGDEHYKELGTKFAKTIYEPISQFLDLLRIRYGQYWVRDIRKWDSSKESIGNYCELFFVKWSEDEGKSWNEFKPDNEPRSAIIYSSSIKEMKSFLSKEDWRNTPEILKNYHRSSVAERTLVRVHQYLDQGDFRHAIIEGATAVELATSEFFNMKLDSDSKIKDELNGFWGISVSGQLVAIGTTLGIPEQKLQDTIEVIKTRHKVVHEGLDPDAQIIQKIRTLLETTSMILGEPKFRFPSSNPGNMIQENEDWEKENG
ncbi:hypothetical protein NKOR_06970 [Candidatus Nitrosopumilus koreensis AR1]|uniref:Uncharacterized protein n=1 Tax=Candidatus Nitrosopumilus koreensis AR1 TaxID=1229908 RepID=K0B8F2_9ARCH|nr:MULTISPECIES: hypothetical protein [Nitrosopumilus]AFS81265.1 hypothetical protein NKOR_06970 [Candidatus Nitrosopumilus koreensis AR1]